MSAETYVIRGDTIMNGFRVCALALLLLASGGPASAAPGTAPSIDAAETERVQLAEWQKTKKEIKTTSKKGGKAVGKGATQFGKGVAKGAKEVGKGAAKAGRSIKKGFRDMFK